MINKIKTQKRISQYISKQNIYFSDLHLGNNYLFETKTV